jgi:hypothetical protein
MSVFAPTKEQKVHHSEYIRTSNTPDEAGSKPVEPVSPEIPELK